MLIKDNYILKLMRSFFCIILIIVGLSFFCTSISARLPTEVDGYAKRDYWQFIFLLDSTKTIGQSEFNFHPFYSQYTNYEKAYDYSTVLYPIFYSHGTNYWRRWTWLYFFSGDDFYHQDTGEDKDLLLFPLSIGSGDAEEDSYFGIFPIYGKFNDFLGFDEFTYFMLNLYVSWSYKDYTAYSFLWPIFLYGSSPTRTEFRIFPFYSSKTKEDKYARRSVLWPFFQWGSLGLDRKEARHYFLFWPFWSQKWSDNDNLFSWSFLWLPYLGGLVSYGREDVKEEVGVTALFSFFQYYDSKTTGINKLILFPFFGYYRFGQQEEEYEAYYNEGLFITPLFARLRTYSAIVDTDYHFFVPLYWNMKRYYHKTREEESYVKVWPFFQYIENSEGSSEFRSLVLWPWRSDQFEKTWGPFYSLIEYQHFENEDKYLSFLFRSVSTYWNDNESNYFVMGLEWHNSPEHTSFEILGGLFGVHKYILDNGEGDWAFEFLWIDISRDEEIEAL